MTDPHDPEAVAKQRFFIIGAARLFGAVLTMLGLLTINGTIEWPAMVGYILLVIGLVDFFLMPVVLAKRWRSPTE